MRLLLVEDDERIALPIKEELQHQRYVVALAFDGETGLHLAEKSDYSVIVLDLLLPKVDGVSVCHALRTKGYTGPILMMTARSSTQDKVLGLDAGADDYLVKPFDLDELSARIRALLRRKSGRTVPAIEHLGVILDPATHRVTKDGREVTLSPKEFALLHLLMERPGNILSRTQIEERLYGWGEEVESNAVEVYIHGLRRKLGSDFIVNVRGVGYRVRPSE